MLQESIVFGPFAIHRGLRQAARDGVAVAINQRGFALLEALIDAGGQPVAKEELLRSAWPGLNVDEVNLTVQISALRKALGTTPDGRDWIVTVPRFGYR